MCGDADAPSACAVVTRKARKRHRCFECGKPIEAGEVYEFTSGVWPDGPASFKICRPCVNVRDSLQCTCVAFGEVMEQAEEEGLDFWGERAKYMPAEASREAAGA